MYISNKIKLDLNYLWSSVVVYLRYGWDNTVWEISLNWEILFEKNASAPSPKCLNTFLKNNMDTPMGNIRIGFMQSLIRRDWWLDDKDGFPRRLSHYSRKSGKKENSSPDLSPSKTYSLFTELHPGVKASEGQVKRGLTGNVYWSYTCLKREEGLNWHVRLFATKKNFFIGTY